MVEIRENRVDLSHTDDASRARQRSDDAAYALLTAIRKDRTAAVELARLNPSQMSEPAKEAMGRMLVEQLRGQLPEQLAHQLQTGSANDAVLAKLMQRFANANDPNPSNRFGNAPSPEAARQAATDQSTPHQALQWTQFVQKVTHIPQALVRDRHGSAAPKGEGTTLLEILGTRLSTLDGASLRLPHLVERAPSDLSPAQRLALMKATFGDELADKMGRLGISDPLQLVRTGALPGDRATLAEALGMGRGELLTLLMRAELLRIGPGRNGELGMRPEYLLALKDAGIAMLGTMAALRALSHEELSGLYKKLRDALGGFGKTSKGSRPLVKRDLMHWARSAGRRASDIMLTDREQVGRHMGQGDAQELVQAWYLENLFWTELAAQRRQQEAHSRIYERDRDRERQQQQRQQGERDEQQQREEEQEQLQMQSKRDWTDEVPRMSHDDQRTDQLMCFWITDYNAHSAQSGVIRKMYVCIDPDSGAIIPQSIESEIVHGLTG